MTAISAEWPTLNTLWDLPPPCGSPGATSPSSVATRTRHARSLPRSDRIHWSVPFEILISAGSPVTIIAGVICGLALLAAPWPPQPPLRLVSRSSARCPSLSSPVGASQPRPHPGAARTRHRSDHLRQQVGAALDAQLAGLWPSARDRRADGPRTRSGHIVIHPDHSDAQEGRPDRPPWPIWSFTGAAGQVVRVDRIGVSRRAA